VKVATYLGMLRAHYNAIRRIDAKTSKKKIIIYILYIYIL